jgi:hypothetical protein
MAMQFGQGTRIYRIIPEKESAFVDFYKEVIIPWLKTAGETKATVHTARDSSAFLFFVTSEPGDPPWGDKATPGLSAFFAPVGAPSIGAVKPKEEPSMSFGS